MRIAGAVLVFWVLNIMSHQLIIALLLAIAGLLVPIPIMALGILIGMVQAYIFSVLATIFIGAAVGAFEATERFP